MSAELPPSRPAPTLRIEYRGFANVADRREYLLVLYRPEGLEEFRFSIAVAAFGARLIRPQDAPDFCYQKLLQAVADGAPASSQTIHIEDAELVAYRVAHTPAPPRRKTPLPTPTPSTPHAAPAVPRRPAFVSRPVTAPKPILAPPAVSGFGEGQRVHHAVFGDGVISLSRGGRTAVSFDEHGPKTFLTSLLELQVLSEPYTWETGPRGKNRPRAGTLTS
jgi:hypothetical protein